MPQLGNMKFPYTPAGKQRYQQIKKQLGGNQKITRPINSVKPKVIGQNTRLKEVAQSRSRAGMAAQMDRIKSSVGRLPSGAVSIGSKRPVGGATPPKRRPIDPGYGKRPFPIKRVPR